MTDPWEIHRRALFHPYGERNSTTQEDSPRDPRHRRGDPPRKTLRIRRSPWSLPLLTLTGLALVAAGVAVWFLRPSPQPTARVGPGAPPQVRPFGQPIGQTDATVGQLMSLSAVALIALGVLDLALAWRRIRAPKPIDIDTPTPRLLVRRPLRGSVLLPFAVLLLAPLATVPLAAALWHHVRAEQENREAEKLAADIRRQQAETARRAEEQARIDREAALKRQAERELVRGRQFARGRQIPQWATLPIDPNTPVKDLLPAPPKVEKITGPFLGDDLTRVPEMQLQERPARDVPNTEAVGQIAHQVAKINHLNRQKTDGFVAALRGERPDLSGLPFAMGDACRTEGERSQQFATAVATVRSALSRRTIVDQSSAEQFWERYQALCKREDQKLSRLGPVQPEGVAAARVAALTQMLAPMPAAMHLGLIRYLSNVSHVEATRALARLAIFSAEKEVRWAALDALKVRRERDYTEVLVRGLHYPWPAVARRSAVAIAALGRNDLAPQLVGLLGEPDPRAPVMEEVNDQRVPVVRELVRVNHHRNCLLCHSPGNSGNVSRDVVTAPVPVPGEPLPSPEAGYNRTSPSDPLIVRVDVTYLRQDFSVLQPVADAKPWPELQRFDFLVRRRVLTEEESKEYREKLTPRAPGELSPYQSAALAGLRELTGRDAEPTPEAWRRLLRLPTDPLNPAPKSVAGKSRES